MSFIVFFVLIVVLATHDCQTSVWIRQVYIDYDCKRRSLIVTAAFVACITAPCIFLREPVRYFLPFWYDLGSLTT